MDAIKILAKAVLWLMLQALSDGKGCSCEMPYDGFNKVHEDDCLYILVRELSGVDDKQVRELADG